MKPEPWIQVAIEGDELAVWTIAGLEMVPIVDIPRIVKSTIEYIELDWSRKHG